MTIALLVNIDVDDLAAAVAFYRDGLGLTVGRRLGADAAEMLGASTAIYLLAKPPGSAPAPGVNQRRAYARHWTPVHLDLVVDEIEAATARAERAGAVREGGIRDHAWGRIVQMADPFAHGFCLIELRGRGYDEIAGGGPQ